MDQAGPSYTPSDPLPGTFFGLSLDITLEKLYDLAPDIPDVMGLQALRPSAAVVKVMSVLDSQCIRVVTPDDHVNIGFHEILRCPVMWCTMWKGTAQDCIDHMGWIHKVPLSVKAANLVRFFPPWTVTREQWAHMMMPSISGVAIDTLLFSRIGSPLFHRYWIISRTGSHAAFRGTYLCRMRVFLEESDSAVVRRLHHQLAQELGARIALPTNSPPSVPS